MRSPLLLPFDHLHKPLRFIGPPMPMFWMNSKREPRTQLLSALFRFRAGSKRLTTAAARWPMGASSGKVFFGASCASKAFIGHCKTRRVKAKRDLSCIKWVKRRLSELGGEPRLVEHHAAPSLGAKKAKDVGTYVAARQNWMQVLQSPLHRTCMRG